MSSATSTSSRHLTLVAGCALLVAASAGCSKGAPPAFAAREKLRSEQVNRMQVPLLGPYPNILESSVGKIKVEDLETDQDQTFATKYSRVARLTLPGARPTDVTCVHEPVGSAYPPGFEFANAGAFACRGVVDARAFTLALDRTCSQGVVTLDGTDRYTLKRGTFSIAGTEHQSGEISVLDARGALVAAFDIENSDYRVWFGEPAQGKPSQTTLIVAGGAIYDWHINAVGHQKNECD